MSYHCAPCKDTGVVGGSDFNGPDARWCTCAAAHQRRETEPNYVERINEARKRLRAKFANPGLRKAATVIDDVWPEGRE